MCQLQPNFKNVLITEVVVITLTMYKADITRTEVTITAHNSGSRVTPDSLNIGTFDKYC